MKRRERRAPTALRLLCPGLCLWLVALALCLNAQVLPLPPRALKAIGGREIMARLAPLSLEEREKEIVSQILAGNIPDFLRWLRPVTVANVSQGATNYATFFVTPDYLAVGSDTDYVLMPISPQAGQKLADALDCSLPTRKMSDDIYKAAEVKLAPSPIPPSPAMTTVGVFSNHNQTVWAQRAAQLEAHPLGALVAGHKKDVVISAKLESAPGKVAIYGWHQTNGQPIQPLYLGHTSTWVDYSQCTRLVQQKVIVSGVTNTVARVLRDPAFCGLLSDEGVVRQARYDLGAPASTPASSTNPPHRDEVTGAPRKEFRASPWFNERMASFTVEPEVSVHINAPANEVLANRKLLLIFYALPNGNTTSQTIGKVLQLGDDWHYDIQHIGAQTRFLRESLTNRAIVVVYLENYLKSWPAWRKKYGDSPIPGILAAAEKRLGVADSGLVGTGQEKEITGRDKDKVGEKVKDKVGGVEKVLAGHSGGGSLIFGYLNTVTNIPSDIVRIAFLDSNYAYDPALGHEQKLAHWLRAADHYLCVLAYNDAVALLNGKSFVTAAGGTWGKSHQMQHDLSSDFTFTASTNADFEKFSALAGRVQFILKENPERKVLHTVQVELNGFIYSLVSGTADEGRGYEYFGPRAYSRWIQPGESR